MKDYQKVGESKAGESGYRIVKIMCSLESGHTLEGRVCIGGHILEVRSEKRYFQGVSILDAQKQWSGFP